MAWQNQVPGCFGDADCIFAGHPSDAARAKEAVKAAKTAGATKEDFRKEAIWHIYKNVSAQSVRDELFEKTEMKIDRLW